MQVHIAGRPKDLGGGFVVNRLLPAATRRSIGPFVFADHFGPTTIAPSMDIDVRPHPHIGLATVTYLIEGAMLHRDSLGSVQRIEPGAINWMTAGCGIVHSERKPEDLRQTTYRIHGLQLWVGLPQALEESVPHFSHTPAAAIPCFIERGIETRVLIGSALGRSSPVATASRTLLLALKFDAGQRLELTDVAQEIGVLPLYEDLEIDGQSVRRGTLAVIEGNQRAIIQAHAGTDVMILGGDPLDGSRHLWWNFVSSRRERIRQAADDWEHRRLGEVAGENDFIPLPVQAAPDG